jgi:hypothetical protein
LKQATKAETTFYKEAFYILEVVADGLDPACHTDSTSSREQNNEGSAHYHT